jgi:nitroreductase
MPAVIVRPAEALPVQLPKPRQSGGKPLLETIRRRKSVRRFQAKVLAMQMLSDLLWAAFGISGDHLEHHTAPSARNWRETDIFVVLSQGAYRFDPTAERLEPVSKRDLRAETGGQDFAAIVPLNLVYIADFARMEPATDEERRFFSALDVGAICENVCLFCASEGLATVVRTTIDRAALAKDLGLTPHQHIVAAQSIGYPAD